MGELPRGWVVVSLGELLLNIEAGKSFKCEERTPEPQEVGVVKVSAVSWGRFQEGESKTCLDSTRITPSLFIKPGDFLFSRANTIELVGACVIADQVSSRLMLSDKILRLNFLQNDMKIWVLHFLRSKLGRSQIEALASGNQASMRNIGQERISQIRLPIPPRVEQTRIVEKLEALLSGLDAGMAELKAAQHKLAHYRQSLLKAAVQGELSAAWRERHPPAETGAQLLTRILTERRTRWEARQRARFAQQAKAPPKGWQNKYPEPAPPDTAGLPDLPLGWVWATVEQLADLVSGHTPKNAADHALSAGEIPWFKVGDMNRQGNSEWMTSAASYFSLTDTQFLGMKVAPAGTIIFPKRGGAIATNKKRRLSVPGCFDLNTMGLVCVDCVAEWLWHWFLGVDLGKLSDGSNVPQINNPDIAPLLVPVPPLEEQAAIIEILGVAMRGITDQEAAVAAALKQSTAQRQNILRAAFTGQLVPHNPADEPASALLARIRTERAAQGDGKKKPRGRKAKGRDE